MQAFAALLDALSYQPARNAKLRLIETYLRETPDPDRGWALAALTSGLDFPAAKPRAAARLRRGQDRARTVPPVLRLCRRSRRDAVADLGDRSERRAAADLGRGRRTRCRPRPRCRTPAILKRWLGLARCNRSLGAAEAVDRRVACRRVGAARQAGGRPTSATSRSMPGRGDLARPHAALPAAVRLAAARRTPAEQQCGRRLPAADAGQRHRARRARCARSAHFRAEWKWDGIRVQVASSGGLKRLYSRAGEDVSAAFPDIIEAIDFEGVFDGELLVRRDETVAPFNDLQQRLNRKAVTPKMLKDHPRACPALRRAVARGRGPARALLRPAPRPPGSLDRREAPAALRRLAAGDLHRLGPPRASCASR